MKTLHTLKTRHRCVGIKTSFEDEGANFNDIIKLRRLTSDTGIQLSLKVGGAEAKTDIKSSVDICCDSIVGPMIESQYAFDKYALSCKKLPTRKGVNIETITAIQNMDLILSSQYLDEIDYFVIGRVDLVGSLGKTRDSVDDAENLSMIESTFRKIKQHGKKTYLGGSISSKSKEFIRHLYDQNILDYIETRYIIMKLDPTFFDTFDDAIVTSHQFELEWMQHLYTKYSDMSAGFHTRMQMAQARVNTTVQVQQNYLTERLLSPEKATTIYLIRHGETVLTPFKKFSGNGPLNPELTDIGLAQAEKVAMTVATLNPDVIIASPLKRTTQTAEAIARTTGLPINFEESWIECSFGIWDGLSIDEVKERYPADYQSWISSTGFAPPEGESYDKVAVRIDAALHQIAVQYPGQRVVVVTHNVTIKSAAKVVVGASAESIFHMDVSPCSITTVNIWPSDGLRALRSLNEQVHLQ
jgi:broad specificity phosphatase PhoE